MPKCSKCGILLKNKSVESLKAHYATKTCKSKAQALKAKQLKAKPRAKAQKRKEEEEEEQEEEEEEGAEEENEWEIDEAKLETKKKKKNNKGRGGQKKAPAKTKAMMTMNFKYQSIATRKKEEEQEEQEENEEEEEGEGEEEEEEGQHGFEVEITKSAKFKPQKAKPIEMKQKTIHQRLKDPLIAAVRATDMDSRQRDEDFDEDDEQEEEEEEEESELISSEEQQSDVGAFMLPGSNYKSASSLASEADLEAMRSIVNSAIEQCKPIYGQLRDILSRYQNSNISAQQKKEIQMYMERYVTATELHLDHVWEDIKANKFTLGIISPIKDPELAKAKEMVKNWYKNHAVSDLWEKRALEAWRKHEAELKSMPREIRTIRQMQECAIYPHAKTMFCYKMVELVLTHPKTFTVAKEVAKEEMGKSSKQQQQQRTTT